MHPSALPSIGLGLQQQQQQQQAGPPHYTLGLESLSIQAGCHGRGFSEMSSSIQVLTSLTQLNKLSTTQPLIAGAPVQTECVLEGPLA